MRELPYLVIITISCLVFFSSVLLSTNSLIQSNASDIPHQYYPYLIFLKGCLEKGIICLWNPLILGGFPWFANPDSNLFYIPTLVFTKLLMPHLAINYSIIFHVLLTGIFTYFYLREVKIPQQFSIFGSLLFMFSGFVVTRVYAGHFTIINAIPWIPLIFLLIEKTIKSKNILLPILLGTSYAMQFLGSQPQIFIYTFLVTTIYFLFRIISEKGNQTFKKILILILTFLGIAAIQIFPAYEFFKQSVRAQGLPYDQITSSSLPPNQLLSIVLPEFFGTSLDYTTWGASNFWELTGYVGIVPIIFTIFALAHRRDRLTIFFLALALFSILYSFGKYNPLFKIVENIPVLNSFRIPARFLLFFTFAISILSSIGFYKIFTNIEKYKKLIKLFYVLALVSSVLTFGGFLLRQNILNFAEPLATQHLVEVASTNPISPTVVSLLEKEGIQYFTFRIYNHIMENLLILNVSLIGFLFVYNLFSKKIIEIKWAIVFILLLLLLDLWSFGADYISTAAVSLENLYNLPSETFSYRILSLPEVYLIDESELARRGIQRFDGYYVAKLSYYDIFFELAKVNPNIMKIGNVVYEYKSDGTANEKVSLPRAFFVNPGKTTEINQPLEILSESDFDPGKSLLIDDKLVEIKELKPLEVAFYEPDSVEIEVKNDRPGYVIVLDTWYPGWKAYADGQKIDIKRAYYIMRGVEIRSKVNNIKLSFEPYIR